MSVLKAVEALLEQAHTPLHYRELTSRMLDQQLWQTTGKTPSDTVSSQLAVDIIRRGTGSRFQRTADGVFALRAWNLPEYVRMPSGKAKAKAAAPNPMLPPTPPAFSQLNGEKTQPDLLSFTDATQYVLEHVGNKRPMHYRDITRHALQLGLVKTEGRTPEATLYAQLLSENARRLRRGEPPRFVKFGKGMVGLARWQGRGLAGEIEQHNVDVRKKLLGRLHEMDPGDFEGLVGLLLAAIGFDDVAVTARSGDGGIDVRGTLVVGDVIRTRMAVQVKRWKQGVQRPIVQQVRGSLGAHEQGLIITTGDFSAGAREEALRPDATPVGLMNGEQLVALLVEHDIGVRRTTHDLIELGEVEPE